MNEEEINKILLNKQKEVREIIDILYSGKRLSYVNILKCRRKIIDLLTDGDLEKVCYQINSNYQFNVKKHFTLNFIKLLALIILLDLTQNIDIRFVYPFLLMDGKVIYDCIRSKKEGIEYYNRNQADMTCDISNDLNHYYDITVCDEDNLVEETKKISWFDDEFLRTQRYIISLIKNERFNENGIFDLNSNINRDIVKSLQTDLCCDETDLRCLVSMARQIYLSIIEDTAIKEDETSSILSKNMI